MIIVLMPRYNLGLVSYKRLPWDKENVPKFQKLEFHVN